MNVLKNYKLTKEKYEEFPFIKIRDDDEVFEDLPICSVDFGREIEKPVLFKPSDGTFPKAVELRDLIKILSTLKKFHFKIEKETGALTEVPEKESEFSIRLPQDTNVEELKFINGQIIKEAKVEDEKKENKE